MNKMIRRTQSMTEDRQFFIFRELAQLNSLSSIIRSFAEEYGGERITMQTVRSYNPHDWHANKYAKANAELFNKIRQNTIDQLEGIPIANRVWRVRELQGIYDVAKENSDPLTSMRALEMAAKEVGGLYTNARTIDTKVSLETWTDDELNRRLIELCGGPEEVPRSLRSLVIEHQPEEDESAATN